MKSKYTKELLLNAVKNVISVAGVLRFLNLKLSGGNYAYIQSLLKKHNIDTNHFKGYYWKRGLVCSKRKKPKEYLIIYSNDMYVSSYKIKKWLIRDGLKISKCEECNLYNWNKKPIPLELHHINGNKNDYRIVNLRFLCKNCHALTINYASKNKKIKT